MKEDEGQEIIAVDNWIKFQAPKKIAELVKVHALAPILLYNTLHSSDFRFFTRNWKVGDTFPEMQNYFFHYVQLSTKFAFYRHWKEKFLGGRRE